MPPNGSQLCQGEGACKTQSTYELCPAGPPKTDGLCWRVLTKHGPLEEEVANHPSILATLTSELPGKQKNVKVSAKSQGEHPEHGEVEISGL